MEQAIIYGIYATIAGYFYPLGRNENDQTFNQRVQGSSPCALTIANQFLFHALSGFVSEQNWAPMVQRRPRTEMVISYRRPRSTEISHPDISP
jgi:hypothetical protein